MKMKLPSSFQHQLSSGAANLPVGAFFPDVYDVAGDFRIPTMLGQLPGEHDESGGQDGRLQTEGL